MCSGGTSRASGMLLHYKPMGSQDAQQLRMEAADDKKVASLWLAAMHKVRRPDARSVAAKTFIIKEFLDSRVLYVCPSGGQTAV